MAVKIATEPIFEADFKDCSYGFRLGWWVVDPILKGISTALTMRN